MTDGTAKDVDTQFVQDINSRLAEYRELMDDTKLRAGLSAAMSVSARGNQYLQECGLDNSLLANQPDRCAQVLLNAINLIYLVSVVIHPFMPSTTDAILRQLNAPPRSLPTEFSIDILPGHTLNKAEHLFKKIENVNGEQEKKWQRQFGGDAVVADQVQPSGPGGHAEGGAVPNVKDVSDAGGANKKELHELRKQQALASKRAAKAAGGKDKGKSPEEKELEAKVEAQGKIVAALKMGKAEGDVEKEMALAKELKGELVELRKKLKEASIA